MLMRTIVFLLLFVVIHTPQFAQSTNAAVEDRAAQLQKLLEEGLANQDYAGVCAGFSIGDKTISIKSAGFSDISTGDKLPVDALIRPASIAKPMTSIAILQLHEKGLLDLDAAIQTYIPTFPKKEKGAITCRQLLQHISGIGAYKSGESENKKEFKSTAEAAAVFQDRSLLFAPGSSYRYTTYGYVVLGLVIEAVSGKSYEEYMQENIWGPAGMKNTHPKKVNAPLPKQAGLHKRNKKKKLTAFKGDHNISNRVPGGGLITTIEDLLLFGQAVLDDKLITAESKALMWTNPGVREGGNPYGMGWFLYGENPKHGMVYGHSGGQTGSSAQMMILPERDAVVVVLSNTSGAWREIFQIAISLFDLTAASQ